MKKTTLLLIFCMFLFSACSAGIGLTASPTPTTAPTQIPTATPQLMDTEYFLSIINGGFEYSNKEYGEDMEGIEVIYEGANKHYPFTLKLKVKSKYTKTDKGCYSVLGTLIYTLIRDNTVNVFPATLKDVVVECYDSSFKLVHRYTLTWNDAVAMATANEIDLSKIFYAPFTPTPKPASTKTFNEKVQECEKSNVGIRYVITGDKVSSVSITQENDTSGTEQGKFALPYCDVFKDFDKGDFLYISAQIESGSGSITCKIYDEEKLISQATASGGFSIATCSATK